MALIKSQKQQFIDTGTVYSSVHTGNHNVKTRARIHPRVERERTGGDQDQNNHPQSTIGTRSLQNTGEGLGNKYHLHPLHERDDLPLTY